MEVVDADAEYVDDEPTLLCLLLELRAVSKTTKLSSSYALLLSSEDGEERLRYFVLKLQTHLH